MSIQYFDQEKIAKEVINVLAKHEVAINATDIIFEAVKNKLSYQKVEKIDTKED